MKYDITRPWLSLDEWQKNYIETPPEEDCFILCGRQSGKTTAMSIKAVELCVKHFKKGQNILICSITEKQAYRMLAKAQTYAEEVYPKYIRKKGRDKPTMHKLIFTTGAGIYCYAAGETGEGLRGDTIKKLMIDEGSRMKEEFYISVMPMMSVVKGSMDIASTPAGKLHRDGSEKFFYKCSYDDRFKKFYISSEDCPRHSKEFLEDQKKKMSKLAYAQEYLAIFTDALQSIFQKELLDKILTLKREENFLRNRRSKYFIGVDVAGFGKDECTFEVLERRESGFIYQRENIIEKRNYTTDTSRKIINLNKLYNFNKIGVDDGGIGFGVYSELMKEDSTKRKTEALNNASREISADGSRSKKLLKEEMYLNLLALMENGTIRLLDDDEVRLSLSSMQYDENGRVFGGYSHIAEGIVRAAWLAEKNKGLNIFARSF